MELSCSKLVSGDNCEQNPRMSNGQYKIGCVMITFAATMLDDRQTLPSYDARNIEDRITALTVSARLQNEGPRRTLARHYAFRELTNRSRSQKMESSLVG